MKVAQMDATATVLIGAVPKMILENVPKMQHAQNKVTVVIAMKMTRKSIAETNRLVKINVLPLDVVGRKSRTHHILGALTPSDHNIRIHIKLLVRYIIYRI